MLHILFLHLRSNGKPTPYVCYVTLTSYWARWRKWCQKTHWTEKTCCFWESVCFISKNDRFSFFWKLLYYWRNNYEGWVAVFRIFCEHNLPALAIGDHVGKLFKVMFPDSKIAKKNSCSRIKTTHILWAVDKESVPQPNHHTDLKRIWLCNWWECDKNTSFCLYLLDTLQQMVLLQYLQIKDASACFKHCVWIRSFINTRHVY